MTYCGSCGGHPCHCWRALERERVATTPVQRVSWECRHLVRENHPERSHQSATPGQWWFGHRSIWLRRSA